jgi:hypothetical protein
VADIIAGSLIGTGFALASYHMNYPSLMSDDAALPKSRHSIV